MNRRRPNSPEAVVLVLTVVAGLTCKAKEQQFLATIYPCTADAECGTSPAGAPLFCYKGRLDDGARGFCAESCDPQVQPSDSSRVCSATGALLWRCHPHATDDDRADCPAGLNCYRTNLFQPEGVCMDVPLCGPNKPCQDPYYASCPVDNLSGDLVKVLQVDHLNCNHRGCRASGANSACRNGEGCLGNVYGTDVADICVPLCDPDLRCPPNYSCLRATSGPAAPELCNPSTIGNRCEDGSCVIGTCDDSGAGFRVCALPCGGDPFCKMLDSQGFSFSCVTGPAGPHCVATLPFHGANCGADEDCRRDLGEVCFFRDPNGPTSPGKTNGECRLPCKPDGTCDPRGGLPHTCLGENGGCFPGELGTPCTLASECLNGLVCQDVPPDGAANNPTAAPARICTVPCDVDAAGEAAADAQCEALTSSQHNGIYCGAGFCRQPTRKTGDECTRDTQCISNRCDPMDHLCLETTTP